ncbi:MAG: EAL domain-containing protein [Deltaproteobacteria bacterium]|nr:EAL domain-containing protein [Deltaproteobacteria bacterium]
MVISLSGVLISNILIYAIIRTGLNKRFKDPSLTLLQMVMATFWIMLIVYYGDSLRSFVVIFYIVVFMFGLFKLNVWQFLFLSVFAIANYAVGILLLYKTHPESINTKIDLLTVLVLVVALPWFSLIGGYITKLKTKISNALSTIERLTNNIHDVIFVLDMNLNYTYVSPSVKILRGYEPEEVLKQALSDAFAPSSLDLAMRTISEVVESGKSGHQVFESQTLQLEIGRKDGTTVWTETKISIVIDKNNQPVGILGVMRDITERKQAEEALRESEERYKALFDRSLDLVYIIDFEGLFIDANDTALNKLGYTKEDLRKVNIAELLSEDQLPLAIETIQAIRDGIQIRPVEFRLQHKNGGYVYVETQGAIIMSHGTPVAIQAVARDITERKQMEQKLNYMATHDVLTGLPNRLMFSQLLNHGIQSARRNKRQLAVLFIDLDRFKTINDTMGHDAGDQLLQEMARRFKQSLRAVDVIGRPEADNVAGRLGVDDVVGRLGGDEFVILIEEVNELSQIATVAHKILTTIIKPVVLLGEECRVTASIGISVYPGDGEDEQSLMKNADIAMYFAKEEGKNNYQFYSKDLQSQSIERLSIETNMRLAMERKEFSLHYQAKLDFKTGMITGVEALLRWQNPYLGSVTPTQFIPVAEQTGLIVPLGRWVLKTACAQNVAWQRQGLPPVCVAVNLSLRQLTDDNLLEDITAALEDSGLAPNLLELEITESMVMRNPTRLIAVLKNIKKLGVRLALDDFGTGYSSLAQIKHYPIDTLKVDRSFIRNLPQDSEDKAITEAIINMGKTLSLTVVAEGVETQAQEDFLREHVCDEMQGFYFSKPIAPDQFGDLLRNHDPASKK